jgi:DNA-binding NarL/FixJ family response regulator
MGMPTKQIADQLSITEETVNGRVESILSKLHANDGTHGALIELKRGIIEF